MNLIVLKDNNQTDTGEWLCPSLCVQLVIGELVIIFFIGHWNLVIGYYSLFLLLSSSPLWT